MVTTAEACIDAQSLYLLAQGDNRPLPSAVVGQSPPVSAPRHAIEVRPAGNGWAINTNYVTLLDMYYKGELKRLSWYRSDVMVVQVPLVAFGSSGAKPQFIFAAVLSSSTLHVFTVDIDSRLTYSSYDIGGGGGVTPGYVDEAVAAEAALRIAADSNLQWQIDNIQIDVPIDSALDTESTHPVENRVITGALEDEATERQIADGLLQGQIEEVAKQTDWDQGDASKIDYLKNKPTPITEADINALFI